MLARQAKTRFAAAIGRLMRPVIRQMIAYGVSYPAFDRIVKQLYVEVAEYDFPLSFKRQTDSRLALVTGIGRKEIPVLRRRRAAASTVEVEDTVVTHVIGRWLAGSPYTAPDGTPRRLPYESDDADTPSFVRLVRELGRDISVRAVLDELLQNGGADLESNGDVVLSRQAHVPVGVEGKLTLLGSDPAELFGTIVHNIEHDETPWLQRKVVYDNIGSDALEELRHGAQRVGETFLRRANELVAPHDRDRNPQAAEGRRSRVVIGVYYFEEGTPAPKDGDDRPPPPGRIRRSS